MPEPIPALLMSTCRCPTERSTSSASARTWSSDARSARKAGAGSPSRPSSRARASSRSRSRPWSSTCAPLEARSRATPRPSPSVAPVIGTRFYEVHARSALNHVPERSRVPFPWTVNPYRGCSHACTYCFARPTHEYLDLGAGRDFEKEIVVKVNAPEVLRAELARPSWKREHVALGTNTDPYQWVEGRYKLMRGIWEALRDFANPCSILTKSPLLLRDKDLLKEIQQFADVSACLSVPTLEEKAWRATEPHTPHPRA